jgi:hypothetical protein
LPPQLQLKRQRKIPRLSNTEVKNVKEVSIVEEVTVNGVEIAVIVATVEVVVVELQGKTMMDSLSRLVKNLSQEVEVATVVTEVAKEATEATRGESIEVLVTELEVASAQERRELLNLPSHKISNEKFEKKVWD